MLVIKPGTKIKPNAENHCFYFLYTLDETNWKTDQGSERRAYKTVLADADTLLVVRQTAVLDDMTYCKVELGTEIGWVSELTLISMLYGSQFALKTWDSLKPSK